MSQLCMLTSSYTTSLITQGLQEMYNAKTLLDLELFDTKGEALHAHSCVLAAVSPVLKGHLSNGQNPRIQRLCFQDISANDWKCILDFIYMGEVIISVDQVKRMLKISQSLEIEELLELCKLSMEQSTIFNPTTVELEPALQDTHGASIETTSPVPAQPATQVTQQRSLIKASPAAVLQSSRFPQHSVTPGRGSQCPYTKDGTLARHRLTPMATGTITGPFGTVEVSTNELDTEELMHRVNQAFFGSKDGSSDLVEPPKKKQKMGDQEETHQKMTVKIKTEEPEQLVYLSETGEISTIQEVDETPVQSSTSMEKSPEDKPNYKRSKTLYKCTQCDLEFPFGPKLKRHEEEHRVTKGNQSTSSEFRCPDCNKEFPTERALNFHTRLNCNPLHGCDYCAQKFHFRYQLDEHCLADHKDEAEEMFPEEIQCQLCEETFRSEALLNHHKGRSHRGWKKMEKSIPIKCTHCDEIFKVAKELQQHVKQKHTPTQCDYCKELCESRNALVDHLHDCTLAPLGEAEKLAKSVRGPSRAARPINCPHCQVKFPSKAALVRHNDKEHDGKDMTYCTTCQKKFQTITAFRNHMMRHYGIRPFKCDNCDKRFTEERDMLKHKANAHGHARPHQCPHCEWSFKDVSALYGHAKRKHKVVLSRNQNRHLRHVQIADDTLVELLVEECAGKRQDEATICVLCQTQFQRRGNMYTHGKQIHKKDFHKLLKLGMKALNLSFPTTSREFDPKQTEVEEGHASETMLVSREEAENIIKDWADGATGGEEADIGEVTSELVETMAENGGIVLQESDLQQQCPICGVDCGDRTGIVKHGREEHDVDLLVVLPDDKRILMSVELEEQA